MYQQRSIGVQQGLMFNLSLGRRQRYRSTSLVKKRLPLGPYSAYGPTAVLGRGHFLMSEVPLCRPYTTGSTSVYQQTLQDTFVAQN